MSPVRGFLEDSFMIDPFMVGAAGVWTKQVRASDSNSFGFLQNQFLTDPFLTETTSQWTKREKEVETL